MATHIIPSLVIFTLISYMTCFHMQGCDYLCARPVIQQKACCRAHGYKSGSCNGGSRIKCEEGVIWDHGPIYEEVFSDNFEGNLDKHIWSYDEFMIENDHLKVANNTLIISPSKIGDKDNIFVVIAELDSDSNKIEFKAKIAKRNGCGLAVLHEDVNGHYAMTQLSFDEPKNIVISNDGILSEDDRYPVDMPTNLSDNFHIYRLDWNLEKVTWSIDGQELKSFDVAINSGKVIKTRLQFLLTDQSHSSDKTNFEVDWVKVSKYPEP